MSAHVRCSEISGARTAAALTLRCWPAGARVKFLAVATSRANAFDLAIVEVVTAMLAASAQTSFSPAFPATGRLAGPTIAPRHAVSNATPQGLDRLATAALGETARTKQSSPMPILQEHCIEMGT
jgi:hypothetical protein